jgi:hypothetical protein
VRSKAQDQSKIINFMIRTPDAASGAGLAQPGNIPYSFSRVSTGLYRYTFDSSIVPTSVVAGVAQSVNCFALVGSAPAAGTFDVTTMSVGTTPAATNAWHSASVTAIDNRRT